jgi:hypothetical protein
MWNPADRGEFAYLHGDNNTQAFQSTVWMYHNSFEGGEGGVAISSYLPNKIANVRFLNNIFSTAAPMIYPHYTAGLGRFAYNLVPQLSGTWYHPGNIVTPGVYQWGGASPSIAPPDFLIADTSLAWDAGTNLAGLLLPDSVTIDDGAADIGWHEFENTVQSQTPPTFVAALNSQLFETGEAVYVRIQRSGTSAGVVSGTLSLSGTATAGANYIAPSASWSIAAGNGYVDVAIVPINDNVRTGDLTIIVTLNPGAGYTVAGGPAQITFRDSAQNLSIPRGPARRGSFNPPRL